MIKVDDSSGLQGAQCTNDKKWITSPRCVMTFDLSSPPSARLSPVMVQEQYNEAITRKVKILALRGNFKEALQIGNEYLQQQIRDGWGGPLSYFQTTFQLHAPLILPIPTSLSLSPSQSSSTGTSTSTLYTFQVRLGTQLTTVDEITTIVLQCWYELAKKDSPNHKNNRTKAWRHLLPLLDMYSKHPMPLQFLVEFWIPFWHSFPWKDSSDTNHLALQQCALVWSCQVALFLMEHSNRIEGMPVLIEELRDQLILFLVTQQLAKVSSPTLATQLLKMVLLQQPVPVPTSEFWKHYMIRPSEIKDPVGGNSTIYIDSYDNPRSLYALRQALEEVPDLAASTTTSPSTTTNWSITKELRDKILQHDKFQNLPLSDWTTQPSLSMIPQPLFSYKWMRSLLVKWQSIVHRFPVEVQSRFWNQWWHNARALLSSSSVGSTTTTTTTTTTTADHPQDPQRSLVQQYKGPLALSIVSLLLAWRCQGFFKKWGRACTMALLAPFTELVDALVSSPPRPKSNK